MSTVLISAAKFYLAIAFFKESLSFRPTYLNLLCTIIALTKTKVAPKSLLMATDDIHMPLSDIWLICLRVTVTLPIFRPFSSLFRIHCVSWKRKQNICNSYVVTLLPTYLVIPARETSFSSNTIILGFVLGDQSFLYLDDMVLFIFDIVNSSKQYT